MSAQYLQRICLLAGVWAVGILPWLLSGCASPPPPPKPVPVVSRGPDYQAGMRLFRIYCASCHDAASAHPEAPTLDDIEAWDERAFQWEAVLRQHASEGFLSMPAKGDQPELSEQSMDDILYYMVTRIKALDE